METIPDNYDFFRMHEDEQDKLLEQRPVFVCCGDHIQDDYCYDVGGEIYCEDGAHLDPGESCDCLEKKKENNKNILAAYRSGRDGQMEMKLEDMMYGT